jgi:hypothetical protein
VTDNSDATGTITHLVSVASPSTGGPALTGSSSQGPKGTWNATVTVTRGTPGAPYSGIWSVLGGGDSGCAADPNGTCSFSRTDIPKKVASVTWTSSVTGEVVAIAKP